MALPLNRSEAGLPLQDYSPYKNGVGVACAERINACYEAGTAAGLTQDTFRSFDNGHSSLRMRSFPHMHSETPVSSYRALCENILIPRITMGVRSLGVGERALFKIQGRCVTEYDLQESIRTFYTSGEHRTLITDRFYRNFYENNFLFCAPAVGTFTLERDSFSFLSPFYLHAIGKSHSDVRLLGPLVFASDALPPALKTRIMRGGLFVPTMMYLFKSHIGNGLKSAEAHVPAYLIPESEKDYQGPTPFLDKVVNAAHALKHIPPVARMTIDEIKVQSVKDYPATPFIEDNVYSFTGVLREGETIILTMNLRKSWTDGQRPITQYFAKKLRGGGTLETLDEEGSQLRITVPWAKPPRTHDYRSDFLLLVNDGTYDSAPAYVSIRHVHPLEPMLRGRRVK